MLRSGFRDRCPTAHARLSEIYPNMPMNGCWPQTTPNGGTARQRWQFGEHPVESLWRWQARFMAQGVEGLTRDKTRKPGKQPLPASTVQRVVDLTLGPPPGEATHWTGRMLAKAVGVSLRSVQRILEAHQLAPHRIRTFKLSTDPKFAEKLKDVVGLYVNPPAHAVVLSVDEKSQIQALDRTQPGLPMKPGRAGTMTHDYKRHGTTTLFAALNILDGTVIGRNHCLANLGPNAQLPSDHSPSWRRGLSQVEMARAQWRLRKDRSWRTVSSA